MSMMTTEKFFYTSTKTKILWSQVPLSLQDSLIIPLSITPQTSIFGFTDHEANFQLINKFLLIFKYYVYKARENGRLEFKMLKRDINKVRNLEKEMSIKEPQEEKRNYERKWKPPLEKRQNIF